MIKYTKTLKFFVPVSKFKTLKRKRDLLLKGKGSFISMVRPNFHTSGDRHENALPTGEM